jgi:hypothetical protein
LEVKCEQLKKSTKSKAAKDGDRKIQGSGSGAAAVPLDRDRSQHLVLCRSLMRQTPDQVWNANYESLKTEEKSIFNPQPLLN